MPKIYAPNKQYTGISAGVPFVNGVGETSDPRIAEWFKRTGYDVEEREKEVSEAESAPVPKKTTKKTGD